MPPGRRRHTDRDRARGTRLAQRLREERGDRSRNDVAFEAQLAPDTIKRIEDGKTLDPGFFTVADLAVVLGLELNELADAARDDRL